MDDHPDGARRVCLRGLGGGQCGAAEQCNSNAAAKDVIHDLSSLFVGALAFTFSPYCRIYHETGLTRE
jgi:hypothetical protein